ncbi:MAG: acyl-protein synthetase, partial [Candidatus Wallbacteria bacterium]|nr:acyl-protein synthetase [Candidatus Wallbacteria bacterium]
AQLAEIPWVFVGVLKQRDLLSVPRERVYREFTSSGTSGRMSRIYLDRPSFDRVILSARNIHEALGMVSPEQEVNYVCFSYDPSKASDLGTSFTDDLLTGFTARREVFFTFRWSDEQGAFFFDKAGTIDRLEDFQRQGLPVRLLGFPAFIYTLLEELVASRGRGFELGRDSWVMTGGGWKTLADKAVSKQRFVADVAVWLRLPRENIRDMFGMVEHGIPYVDCSRQNLHVPLYARIMVRDPETMELLSPGETGLLHFQTPYLTSYPAHSLLTTDLGTIEPGCPCGVAGPIVTIAGRGGVKKHKGCAITAAELFLRS